MNTDPFIKDTVLSVRIPADVDERLKKAAHALDLSKNDVARSALRAVLEAMEKRRYRVVWPLMINLEPLLPRRVEEKANRLIVEDFKKEVREILAKQWKRSMGREFGQGKSK